MSNIIEKIFEPIQRICEDWLENHILVGIAIVLGVVVFGLLVYIIVSYVFRL